MLIVKSGVAPISSSWGLFVCPLQNWEPVLSFACVSCRTTSKCKWFSSAAGEWLIYCLKKNRLTLYSLSSALIISFMAFYFQLQILSYLLVETYHEILHTSNHSESEIKFEVLTDAPLGVILYHDVVLNKQISISQSLKSF